MNEKLAVVLSRVCVLLLVCVMLMQAPGMTALGTARAADDGNGVLRMGFLQPVDRVNPYIGLNDASYVFYGLVYDYMHVLGNDMSVTGNIATGTRPVPVSDPEMIGRPYGSIWEYNITTNARWHDGEPFTVNDVIFNIELQCSDENYSIMWAFQPYTYFMEKAVAIDDDTVRVYFFDRSTKEPKAAAYGYLISMPMLPEHLLKTMLASDIMTWNGVFPSSTPPLVGTGPFMVTDRILEEWTAGSQMTLVRNPNYHWGADKNKYVQFDKIEMNFYDDATSMRLALTSGDLDVAQFPPEIYKSLKEGVADGTYTDIATFDGPKITGFWSEIEVCMSTKGSNPSRLDPVIRQAMATATNKTYIVQNYYRGFANEGSTLIPPIYDKWHYQPTASEEFKFDLDVAADMLESAGYRYPSPTATIREATADSYAVQQSLVPAGTELTYEMIVRQEYPEEQAIANYLKSVWKDIGINLNIVVLYESAMSTRVYSYNYDTCIWYWSMDIDPNYMLYCQTELAWSGWSDNKYYNPAYTENYSLSVSAMDYEDRKMYVDNCQRIHYRDATWIIFSEAYQTYAWRTDTFTGWGDWTANPGRSLDNTWSGNPLLFDLVYIGGGGGGFDVGSASIAAGVGGAIVVVVAAVWWIRKKGKKKKASPLGE